MNEIATINIDKKTVEGIVERQMVAAIVAQLDVVKNDLLQNTVVKLLNANVDSNGKECSYGSTKMLDYLVHQQIRSSAKAAIEKFFEKQEQTFEKEILKAEKRVQSQDNIK